MRRELAKRAYRRETFTGRFVRYGEKDGWTGGVERTVLLADAKDAGGRVVTDHLWFNFTKGFENAGLEEGCIVRFDARVLPYRKGYWGNDPDIEIEAPPPGVDYHLTRPTRVEVVKR